MTKPETGTGSGWDLVILRLQPLRLQNRRVVGHSGNLDHLLLHVMDRFVSHLGDLDSLGFHDLLAPHWPRSGGRGQKRTSSLDVGRSAPQHPLRPSRATPCVILGRTPLAASPMGELQVLVRARDSWNARVLSHFRVEFRPPHWSRWGRGQKRTCSLDGANLRVISGRKSLAASPMGVCCNSCKISGRISFTCTLHSIRPTSQRGHIFSLCVCTLGKNGAPLVGSSERHLERADAESYPRRVLSSPLAWA